jgi:hypothetical protein
VAALAVAVLDVVVDQAEVVAQLHRGGTRERALPRSRDRGKREQPEERPEALARRPGAIEPHVVADHLVHAVGGRVAVHDEVEDLVLDRADERRDVE